MLCITHEITVCQSEFFSKLERIFRKQKKNERESSSQSPFEVLYASCDKGFGNEENEKAFFLHFNAFWDKNPNFCSLFTTFVYYFEHVSLRGAIG